LTQGCQQQIVYIEKPIFFMKQSVKNASIAPFSINIPEHEITYLKDRLKHARWPSSITGDGWQYGVPLEYLKKSAGYWLNDFNWREQEQKLNRYPQFTTEIDGATIHFLHIKSREANALPLLITHGWPGSVAEFINVIDPLTNPTAHGSTADQAFDLIIPSIPGFGFSHAGDSGWSLKRIAGAWAELMDRLGYDRYVVQGGDAGIGISIELSHIHGKKVIALHMNGPTLLPYGPIENYPKLSEADQARYERLKNWQNDGMGYLQIQSTRPNTIGYALNDSPIGLLAWISEKFKEWTDPSADLPEDAVNMDDLLTNVSIYWFTGTAHSAARLLYETTHSQGWPAPPMVPTGVAVYAGDNTVKAFGGAQNGNGYWQEYDKGGHFAALEVPEIFVEDLRKYFAAFRK
jgi:pimeloyl-ACP methyl ester carboxylesterase